MFAETATPRNRRGSHTGAAIACGSRSTVANSAGGASGTAAAGSGLAAEDVEDMP